MKVYSPYATWSRVREAAQGANVLIYLGHGNGWPSPYHPFSDTSKDGMGLNASSGHGNSNLEVLRRATTWRKLGLASHAVVVLNRLCYASGNNEWGAGNPTLKTAKKRVDNYGYGFLKAGAQAVFASGITDVGYVLRGPVHGRGVDVDVGPVLDRPDQDRGLQLSFDSSRIGGVSAPHGPVQAPPLLPVGDRSPRHDGRRLAQPLTPRCPRTPRSGAGREAGAVSIPAIRRVRRGGRRSDRCGHAVGTASGSPRNSAQATQRREQGDRAADREHDPDPGDVGEDAGGGHRADRRRLDRGVERARDPAPRLVRRRPLDDRHGRRLHRHHEPADGEHHQQQRPRARARRTAGRRTPRGRRCRRRTGAGC